MIVFVGNRDRTSGLIRGFQLSQRMPDAIFLEHDDRKLLNIKGAVCVFIRNINHDIARAMRANGCLIGFDILDRPVADYHTDFDRGKKSGDINWKRYESSEIDFYIVNNSLCKIRLESEIGTFKPIFVVPHHTVNNERYQNTTSDVATRVGYVGLGDQFTISDDVVKMCQKYNASFVNVHPNSRDECVRVMRSLDLGLVFADRGELVPYTLMYKPNTKLSNFQSFGIPTIACKYESFDEFGSDGWTRANTKEEFVEAMECFLRDFDRERRKALSDAAYEIGSSFHIDEIIKKYYKEIAKLR